MATREKAGGRRTRRHRGPEAAASGMLRGGWAVCGLRRVSGVGESAMGVGTGEPLGGWDADHGGPDGGLGHVLA